MGFDIEGKSKVEGYDRAMNRTPFILQYLSFVYFHLDLLTIGVPMEIVNLLPTRIFVTSINSAVLLL